MCKDSYTFNSVDNILCPHSCFPRVRTILHIANVGNNVTNHLLYQMNMKYIIHMSDTDGRKELEKTAVNGVK